MPTGQTSTVAAPGQSLADHLASLAGSSFKSSILADKDTARGRGAPAPQTQTEKWPHEDIVALSAFYGDPRGPDGQASPRWETANLVHWTPPYPMFYSDGKRTPMTHLRVHEKCLAAFQAGFGAALEHFGHDRIVELRLDVTGGTYVYRLERGGARLSVHAFACAIDMDPGHNPFPHRWIANHGFVDLEFVEIMRRHGFYWRGDIERRDIDPMHFQLCRR